MVGVMGTTWWVWQRHGGCGNDMVDVVTTLPLWCPPQSSCREHAKTRGWLLDHNYTVYTVLWSYWIDILLDSACLRQCQI